MIVQLVDVDRTTASDIRDMSACLRDPSTITVPLRMTGAPLPPSARRRYARRRAHRDRAGHAGRSDHQARHSHRGVLQRVARERAGHQTGCHRSRQTTPAPVKWTPKSRQESTVSKLATCVQQQMVGGFDQSPTATRGQNRDHCMIGRWEAVGHGARRPATATAADGRGNGLEELSIGSTAMRAVGRRCAAFATRENRNRRPRMR
jgi:hypothetical protein